MSVTCSITYFMPPYGENDQVKAVGGRWSQDKRCWFIPDGVDKELFTKWIPECEIPADDLVDSSPEKRKFGSDDLDGCKPGYCYEYWEKGSCRRQNGSLFGDEKKCTYKHERNPNFVEPPKKQKSYHEEWHEQLEAEYPGYDMFDSMHDEKFQKEIEDEFKRKAKAKGMTKAEFLEHLEYGGNSDPSIVDSDEEDDESDNEDEEEDINDTSDNGNEDSGDDGSGNDGDDEKGDT